MEISRFESLNFIGREATLSLQSFNPSILHPIFKAKAAIF